MTDEGCKLPCPLCGSQNSRTMQTRWADARDGTWRRRLCLDCAARFSTLETLIRDEPAVRVHRGRLQASSSADPPSDR